MAMIFRMPGCRLLLRSLASTSLSFDRDLRKLLTRGQFTLLATERP